MKSCICVGAHRLDNRNAKSVDAIKILRMYRLAAANWRSFDKNNSLFSLDQWIISSIDNVNDYKVINSGVPSDHSATKITLKCSLSTQMSPPKNENID